MGEPIESIKSLNDSVSINVENMSKDQFIEYVSNEECDLDAMSRSENCNKYMMQMLHCVLVKSEATVRRLMEAEQMIGQLKSENEQNQRETSALRERVEQLEGYSRRSTMIMTGLPYNEDENLEKEVCEIINEAKVYKDFEIDQSYVSNVHRNGRFDPNKEKPPSVTVVFVRSMDKDRLFRGKGKFKANLNGEGKRFGKFGKVNIHHAMSEGTRQQKRRLEAFDEVEWVDYRGVTQGFAVKMVNEQFHRGIQGVNDFMSKTGVGKPGNKSAYDYN